ncbi:MAG: hypothetical protein KAR24_02530 [Candidatus Pacebacteria bacterium]|nr:hypothetical protein [Candidatus Paceibacterota bacterium]
MPEPVRKTSSDPLDDIADFYKNAIGSPIALLWFIVFLVVLFFTWWLVTDPEAWMITQTYFAHYLGPYLPTIRTISTILILLFSAGITYMFVCTREVDSIEYHKYRSIDIEEEETKEHGSQWRIVENHLLSENQAKWRIAILEADTMLNEAILRAGAVGDTLGERLKSLDPGDFQTLQEAWDAHKIRNMIAHEGINFQLTQREAKRVIDLYKKVLKELKYI